MSGVLKVVRATGLLRAVSHAPGTQVGGIRNIHVTAASRAGMGTPVPAHEVPTAELVEEAELTWDCGDAHPEPALDQVPPNIVKPAEAAAYLFGGLGLFFGIYNLAKVMDKPSTQPFADKTFPFDGLKTELGK